MDERASLLILLENYSPTNNEDADARDRILRFVREHPSCFQREHVTGHITGSAWIVDPARTKTLLTHHKKLDRWLQLGGHADGQCDVIAVARKEAIEESGLENIRLVSPSIFDVDIHPIPARQHEPAHLHYDIRFLFEADPADPLVISHESNQLAWVSIAELEKYSKEESLLRMKRKLVAAGH